MSLYDVQLQHLIRLARNPGFKSYAWARAKELDADRSGMFTGIAEALKNAINKQP